MKKLSLLTVAVVLFAVSCVGVGGRLEAALRLAGENRAELEKVLAHYSTRGDNTGPGADSLLFADSLWSADTSDADLKYRAAVFLIENMPGHYSHAATKEIEDYYRALDSVLLEDTSLEYKQRIKPVVDSLSVKYFHALARRVEDVQVITADFLIENIDLAFATWRGVDFAKHLDFDQFCEYILPYKTDELQQFDNWRELFSTRYTSDWDRIPISDIETPSPFEASGFITRELRRTVGPSRLGSGVFYSAATMSKIPFGMCDDYATLCMSVLRSHGIPVIREFTPLWGRGDVGHTWFTLLNDSGLRMPFPWVIDSNPGDLFFPAPIPKIFRVTYAPNPERQEFLRRTKYHGHNITPFAWDVTGEYLHTTDLRIPVTGQSVDDYAYIAAFNNHDWKILDFGKIVRGHAHFNNMGRSMIYMVLGYDGRRLVALSEPVMLRSDGTVEYVPADKDSVETVRMTRKFPLRRHPAEMSRRMIGGEIQASNRADFARYETIYRVDSLLISDLVRLSPSTPYRYWRYAGSRGSWGNIAEVQFYEAGSDEIIEGKVIGIEGFPGMERENAFDNDWLTSYDATIEHGAWVGLDIGRRVTIDRVRLIPRSDDNEIHHGDEYELKYWSDGRWNSLGVKVATERVLIYDSVPRGSLLWLSDLTRGREERIFINRNGRQEWW
jgi:hypothetical protein